MAGEAYKLSVRLLHIKLRYTLGTKSFWRFEVLTIKELLIFLEIFGSKAARKNKREDYY